MRTAALHARPKPCRALSCGYSAHMNCSARVCFARSLPLAGRCWRRTRSALLRAAASRRVGRSAAPIGPLPASCSEAHTPDPERKALGEQSSGHEDRKCELCATLCRHPPSPVASAAESLGSGELPSCAAGVPGWPRRGSQGEWMRPNDANQQRPARPQCWAADK